MILANSKEDSNFSFPQLTMVAAMKKPNDPFK